MSTPPRCVQQVFDNEDILNVIFDRFRDEKDVSSLNALSRAFPRAMRRHILHVSLAKWRFVELTHRLMLISEPNVVHIVTDTCMLSIRVRAGQIRHVTVTPTTDISCVRNSYSKQFARYRSASTCTSAHLWPYMSYTAVCSVLGIRELDPHTVSRGWMARAGVTRA